MKNTGYWITCLMGRIKADTPWFFKKLRNAMITIGVASGAVIAANDLTDFGLNSGLIQIMKYSMAISVAIAAVSQTTKID